MNAPPSALANGIASAFRSDQTPPFGQMVSHLFGQSDPQQRKGYRHQERAKPRPWTKTESPSPAPLKPAS